MKIESKYISIPNIVMNNEYISNNSKLLYGLIRYWDFMQIYYLTYNEIKEALNVSSINTIKKCLVELEAQKYIEIIKPNNNKQLIKPLISDGIMIETSINARKENIAYTYQDAERLANKTLFKKFFDEVK